MIEEQDTPFDANQWAKMVSQLRSTLIGKENDIDSKMDVDQEMTSQKTEEDIKKEKTAADYQNMVKEMKESISKRQKTDPDANPDAP